MFIQKGARDMAKKEIGFNNIYVFEMGDALIGGIVVANSEREAWEKLARNRGFTVKQLKGFTVIQPLSSLEAKDDVYDIL